MHPGKFQLLFPLIVLSCGFQKGWTQQGDQCFQIPAPIPFIARTSIYMIRYNRQSAEDARELGPSQSLPVQLSVLRQVTSFLFCLHLYKNKRVD